MKQLTIQQIPTELLPVFNAMKDHMMSHISTSYEYRPGAFIFYKWIYTTTIYLQVKKSCNETLPGVKRKLQALEDLGLIHSKYPSPNNICWAINFIPGFEEYNKDFYTCMN